MRVPRRDEPTADYSKPEFKTVNKQVTTRSLAVCVKVVGATSSDGFLFSRYDETISAYTK